MLYSKVFITDLPESVLFQSTLHTCSVSTTMLLLHGPWFTSLLHLSVHFLGQSTAALPLISHAEKLLVGKCLVHRSFMKFTLSESVIPNVPIGSRKRKMLQEKRFTLKILRALNSHREHFGLHLQHGSSFSSAFSKVSRALHGLYGSPYLFQSFSSS